MRINMSNVRIDLGDGLTLSLSQFTDENGRDMTYSSRTGGTVEAAVFRGDEMLWVRDDHDTVLGWQTFDDLVALVERVRSGEVV